MGTLMNENLLKRGVAALPGLDEAIPGSVAENAQHE